MPLGNLTSQFFANVYLNELDQFVKHKLKVKYYIRYVDDFVILHPDKSFLEHCKKEINHFLKNNLKITLHPEKSKIICLNNRLDFLGFRMFYYYKLLKKQNIGKMKRKFVSLKKQHLFGKIDYDAIYDFLEGWFAYSKYANEYKLRKQIIQKIEERFNKEISTKEFNRYLKCFTSSSTQTYNDPSQMDPASYYQ